MGEQLGSWGIQVSDLDSEELSTIPCYTLNTLLNVAEMDTVDILKIDIEGAELEIFSNDSDSWLERIRLLIIETHDRIRPGSEAAVRRAVQGRFKELRRCGENLLFLNEAHRY